MTFKIRTKWSLRPLSDALMLADSGTWGEEASPLQGAPVLRSTNIKDGIVDTTDAAWRKIPKADMERRALATGDIIVTKSSGSDEHIGKCAQFLEADAKLQYYFSNFTLRLRINTKYSDPRYIYFWLSSNIGKAMLRSLNTTTTGLRNLNVGRYLEQEIPFPPPCEQRRIAAILDKADAIRRKRRQVFAETETLLRATFLDMFGDPATNPHNFDIYPVECVLSTERPGTQSGPFGSALKKEEYVDSGIPVWGIENIENNRFIGVPKLFITSKKFDDLRRYSVQHGDILISRAGTVGRMCIAEPGVPLSIISTNLVRVVLDAEKMLPEFFVTLFTSFPGRLSRLRSNKKDNAFTFLNPGTLKAIEVPRPPIGLQEEFRAKVHKLIAYGNKLNSHQKEADQLFLSISQRAFYGEL